MLAHDEDRAVYGPGHVQAAFDASAIDTLLLSDALFRARSVADRKRWVTLVEGVKDNAGTVFIFSSLHVSGQQLDKFSGVAAILRFPMPDLDDDDDDDSSDED
eukprot:m.60954 g.60954  ORF g.60954 m.60954 type:complete len:103 (+) comp13867_c0_seq11:161-469(+)